MPIFEFDAESADSDADTNSIDSDADPASSDADIPNWGLAVYRSAGSIKTPAKDFRSKNKMHFNRRHILATYVDSSDTPYPDPQVDRAAD